MDGVTHFSFLNYENYLGITSLDLTLSGVLKSLTTKHIMKKTYPITQYMSSVGGFLGSRST